MSETLHWFKSSYSSSAGGECIEVAFEWHKSSYSTDSGGDCVEVGFDWQKSSHSDSGGGSCVEVAACPHTIHLRDSKIPHGPTVAIAPDAWSAFVAWQG